MGGLPAVNKVRFGRFVARVLADARDRGLTQHQIAKVTGVGVSTFHRWQNGDYREAPELERVRAFCAGLGVSSAEAMSALGMDEARDTPEPEPPLDPDVRIILRALADPNVSDEQKRVIRGLLRMLAQQASGPRRQPQGALGDEVG
jgi:transcriptional regulator with XRE-family HTH domain